MNPYLYNSSLLVLICTCFIGLNLSAQNPIANEDTFEIEHLAAGEMPTLNTFEVLANDLNISGELATNLTIVEIIPATALNMEVTTIGTVAIDATNTAILYQQPVAFVGVDSFHYVIQDLNGTADQADTATVFVTIQDVSVIEAVDVAFDLVAGQSINSVNILEDATILLDVLTSFEWISTDLPNGISVIEAFDDGELLFNFTPDASFTFTTAPLELTYEICGELGNCSTGIISININDIPVANQGSLFAPICSGLSPIPDFNLFDLVSDANEIGGDMLSLSIVEEPLPEITANFFFNELTGDISFQPVATSSDDFGSFVYQVCDLQGECDISSVNITIDNIETPILNEDIFSTNLNENILIPILANDIINANHFDFDDIMFSNLIGGNVSLLVSTIEGIETYQALFMPEAGFVGTGSFTYTLNSIPCAESDFVYNGLVTVTIIDPCEESNLTALDDNFEDLVINESSFLDVLVNDNSGEVLETIGGNSTVGAAISVSEGQIVYAPNNNNYFGADTFFYRITNAACLEQGMWDTAMVSLVIDNPCTPPNADDDFELDLFINTATNINVVGNDEGYEAPFLELLSLTSARGATLSIVAEQVNYAPNDTYFTENDTFFYRISNEACTIIDDQVWDTAKVVITIFDPCSDSTTDLCIEPGNTNGDNVIDKFDLFNIGIAFGATGNPRPIDINYVEDWDTEFSNGINHKFADCDGNGVIDLADVALIEENYGDIVVKFDDSPCEPESDPLLWFDQANMVKDITDTSKHLLLPIMLSTPALEDVEDFYAVAFNITYFTGGTSFAVTEVVVETTEESWVIDNEETLDDVLDISKEVEMEAFFGEVAYGVTRTNQQEVSGNGQIAMLRLGIGIKDDLVGEAQIDFTDILLVNHVGDTLSLCPTGLNVIVPDTIIGIDKWELSNLLEIYPNPSQDNMTVRVDATGESGIFLEAIQILDLSGHLVQTLPMSNPLHIGNYQIPTQNLPNGTYLLQMQTNKGTATKKVVVLR